MLGIKRLGLVAALVLMGIAPAAAAQAAVQPSEQDRQFLQTIHQVNLFEIKAGEAAQDKGKNQGVKDLGAMFKEDHTQLDQKVKDTASKVGVDLPNEPTADQQSVLDQLAKASGDEFDRLWVTSQLEGHVKAIQATQTEISQGSEQAVVQLAQEVLPILQAHIDALTQLAQQLGIPVPQASPTGTPRPGGTPAPSGTETGTPAPGGTETGTPAPGGTETGAPAPGGTETPAPAQS